MEIQFTSLEEKLVYEGKLTQYQIEEIRRIFSLFDTDKSGTLTYNELAFAMQNLSKSNQQQQQKKSQFYSVLHSLFFRYFYSGRL